MQDAIINFCRTSYAKALPGGQPRLRNGNQVMDDNGPVGCYRCKGGGPNNYCFIYCGRGGGQWERLLKVIGREDLLADARFKSSRDRAHHAAVLDVIIEAWTLQHD